MADYKAGQPGGHKIRFSCGYIFKFHSKCLSLIYLICFLIRDFFKVMLKLYTLHDAADSLINIRQLFCPSRHKLSVPRLFQR